MAELYALQNVLAEISDLGASLVAITPQTVGRSKAQMEKAPLDYDLVSDAGNEYAKLLGLRFKLPEYLIEQYKQFGLDLPAYNGDTSWTLPMPARLVVDQNGIVRFSEANPDYTRRPEPQITVAALQRIVDQSATEGG